MRRIFFAFILLVVLLFYSTVVFADAPIRYNINNYNSDITVNRDGSVKIDEYINMNSSRKYFGSIKKIDLANASSIENLKMYILEKIDKQDIRNSSKKELKHDDVLSTKDISCYGLNIDNEGESQYISVLASKGNNAYSLSYVLHDLVSIYNDVAVLSLDVAPLCNENKLNNGEINISLPKPFPNDDTQVYVFGCYDYEVQSFDEGFKVKIHNIKKNQTAQIKLLIPPSVVSNGRKKIDKNMLSEIQKESQKWDNEVKKHKKSKQFNIIYIFVILVIIALVFFMQKYLLKSNKKSAFVQKR